MGKKEKKVEVKELSLIDKKIAKLKDKPNKTPKYVATPFPPLKFNQIGKICPKNTVNAATCKC